MPNTEKADNGTSDFNELGGKGARDGDGRKYGYGNADELRETRLPIINKESVAAEHAWSDHRALVGILVPFLIAT